MKKAFFILWVVLCKFSYSQTCAPPTEIKSTSLTFMRYPLLQGNGYKFRLFYKIILECSADPNASFDSRNPDTFPGYYVFPVDDLHVLDPTQPVTDLTQPNGPMSTYAWQLDSIKRVTGQIDPCVVLSKAPCYSIYYYHADANPPDVAKPSVAVMVNCCRPFNSANIFFQPLYWGPGCDPRTTPGTISNGILNFVTLPALTSNLINSSPEIISNDTILNTCINNPFSYKIYATDPDNDSVVYHFGTPKTFSEKLAPGLPHGPEVLVTIYKTFSKVLFKPGFSEQFPAGPNITLDPTTGLLSGNLTDTGTFDITVYAVEYYD